MALGFHLTKHTCPMLGQSWAKQASKSAGFAPWPLNTRQRTTLRFWVQRSVASPQCSRLASSQARQRFFQTQAVFLSATPDFRARMGRPRQNSAIEPSPQALGQLVKRMHRIRRTASHPQTSTAKISTAHARPLQKRHTPRSRGQRIHFAVKGSRPEQSRDFASFADTSPAQARDPIQADQAHQFLRRSHREPLKRCRGCTAALPRHNPRLHF